MRIRLITLLTMCFTVSMNAHESIQLTEKFTESSRNQDVYTCPVKVKDNPCKIVCIGAGNSQPFAKSNVESVTFNFTNEGSFNVIGTTYDSSRVSGQFPNNHFTGYFTSSTSCMTFGMDLKGASNLKD